MDRGAEVNDDRRHAARTAILKRLVRDQAARGNVGARALLDSRRAKFYFGRPKPRGYRWHAERQCYRNSALLALKRDSLIYAEGFALVDLSRNSCSDLDEIRGRVRYAAIAHAWCIEQSAGAVVDVTWRFLETDEPPIYYGVCIPTRDVAARMAGGGVHESFLGLTEFLP
jgi:hypothetical protein